MRRVLVLVALLAAVALGACLKHTYVVRGATPEPIPTYDQWHHHLVFSLVDLTGEVPLESICPQGVARISNRMTFVNGLVSAFTGWIYSPTTVRVYCRAVTSESGEAAEPVSVDVPIELTPATLEQIRTLYPDIERQLADLQDALAAEERALADSRW